jgi:hypothetical protein
MKLIDNITDQAYQTIHIVMDDSTVIDMNLKYLPAQQRWAYDITYGDKSIKGNILCNHPNLLRQWRRILPFGLACSVADGTEPILIDDFTSGRVQIHLLTGDEIEYVETDILAG